jgi:hypothetical protein
VQIFLLLLNFIGAIIFAAAITVVKDKESILIGGGLVAIFLLNCAYIMQSFVPVAYP